MNDIITKAVNLMGNNIFLALLISFLGGIISSFSPCVLSSLPLIIGYVNKYGKNDKKTAFKYSLFFSLGIIITFTFLGIISSLVGRFIYIWRETMVFITRNYNAFCRFTTYRCNRI